jgi:hypothetical protein
VSKNRSSREPFDVVHSASFLGMVLFYFGLLKFQPLYDMSKVVLRDANQSFEFGCAFVVIFA